jgi:FkbM family methyltransferase
LLRSLRTRTYLACYLAARAHPRRSGYGQYGEDLVAARILGDVSTFVDIGAGDGRVGSNTFLFALRGAGGACAEPLRAHFERLRRLYSLRRDVTCVRAAVSSAHGEAPLVVDGGMSRLPATEDAALLAALGREGRQRPTETVPVITFPELISRSRLGYEIDLVSIDVEGHEWEIIKSIPFETFRFGAIIVETHLTLERREVWRNPRLSEIEARLAAHGYEKHWASPVNDIYLRRPA